MLPEGIIRTPMGFYVLRDDVLLSRTAELEHRLDTRDNLVEIMSFAHLIPEGGVAIDAGACFGDHTVSYSQIVGAAGKVHAFEPHSLAYEALVLNTARLRNVKCYRLGLSDANGRAQFNPDPNVGGSFVSTDGPVSIEVRTVDTFLAHIERCDFIHLDAEGLEPRILQGARLMIEKFHPVMLIEVCDKHLRRAGSSEVELVRMINGMGYRMSTIPSSLEPELRDDLCIWEGG